MIVTVIGGLDHIRDSFLSINLAALRLQTHSKVMLIDADMHKHAFLWSIKRSTAGVKPHLTVLPVLDKSLYSELEELDSAYRDMVIDAGDTDALDTKTALVAAQLAVVPLRAHTRDLNGEIRLIRCIEEAKLFNPALRTLLVIVRGSHGEAANDEAVARTLAKEIPSAMIARTVIHEYAGMRNAFDHGMTVFEYQPADDQAKAEMEKLGQEVFGDSAYPEGIFANVKAAGSFLRSLRGRHGVHQYR